MQGVELGKGGKLSPFQLAVKTVVIDCDMDNIFAGINLNEPSTVYTNPKFDTACWMFVNNSGTSGRHQIYFGEQLLTNVNEIVQEEIDHIGLEGSQLFYNLLSFYYHHELSHAANTERDLKKLVNHLKSVGLGNMFRLFNLMEDARIEHLKRIQAGVAFNWYQLEKPQYKFEATPDEAGFHFFKIIQHNGTYDLYIEHLQKAIDEKEPNPLEADKIFAKVEPLLLKVRNYFNRCLSAKDSWEIIPIMQDWLKDFPPPPSESMGAGDMADMSEGMGQIAEGESVEDIAQALENASSEVVENGSGKKGKGEGPLPAEATSPSPKSANPNVDAEVGSVKLETTGTGKVLSPNDHPVDWVRASAIAETLKRVMQGNVRKTVSDLPSRRINLKEKLRGNPQYFSHKALKGQKKLRVWLGGDCSGSMSHGPIEGLRILMAAFNQLSHRKLVEGEVVLSAVGGYGSYNGSIHEKMSFPLATEFITRTDAWAGAEGIEGTIRANIKSMRNSDLCFMFTDGCINDNPVDKDELTKLGIKIIGLYVGPEENTRGMHKWFHSVLVRDSIEELADAIVMLGSRTMN